METIGLTGGIGSGKSTVARIFKHMGFPVYIADTEASHLMNSSPDIRREITGRFGETIYSNNQLNKAELAKIIFEDKEALRDINHIVHPRVMEDFKSWSQRQKSPIVLFESAILYEAGLNEFFGHIICVTAPEEVRIQRVISRDHTTAEKVRDRMNNQMGEKEKISRVDFIVNNDGVQALLPQVIKIIQQLNSKNK